MNKPDTSLHNRDYSEHWKVWIREYLKTQERGSKEEAIRAVMKETRGLINPNWTGEVWDE